MMRNRDLTKKAIWTAATARLLGYKVVRLPDWGASVISPTGFRVMSAGELDLWHTAVANHIWKNYGLKYMEVEDGNSPSQ